MIVGIFWRYKLNAYPLLAADDHGPAPAGRQAPVQRGTSYPAMTITPATTRMQAKAARAPRHTHEQMYKYGTLDERWRSK
jgi:hypothetical protein